MAPSQEWHCNPGRTANEGTLLTVGCVLEIVTCAVGVHMQAEPNGGMYRPLAGRTFTAVHFFFGLSCGPPRSHNADIHKQPQRQMTSLQRRSRLLLHLCVSLSQSTFSVGWIVIARLMSALTGPGANTVVGVRMQLGAQSFLFQVSFDALGVPPEWYFSELSCERESLTFSDRQVSTLARNTGNDSNVELFCAPTPSVDRQPGLSLALPSTPYTGEYLFQAVWRMPNGDNVAATSPPPRRRSIWS